MRLLQLELARGRRAVAVHFFRTATLSFSDQVRIEPGDIFEISAEAFQLPLRNRLTRAQSRAFAVRPL